jgi:hypothetical protein
MNELGRDRRELVRRAFTVAVFIGDVLAFDVSEVAQGLPEGLPHRRIVEDADTWDFGRLLPPCAPHLDREQQTAATDQSNELAPFHVGHGDSSPTAGSLPRTSVRFPWARPESF